MFNRDLIKILKEEISDLRVKMYDTDRNRINEINKLTNDLDATKRELERSMEELTDNSLVKVEHEYILKTNEFMSTDPYRKVEFDSSYLLSDSIYVGNRTVYGLPMDQPKIQLPTYHYMVKEGWNKYNAYRKSVRELSEEDFNLMSGNSSIEIVDNTKKD